MANQAVQWATRAVPLSKSSFTQHIASLTNGSGALVAADRSRYVLNLRKVSP